MKKYDVLVVGASTTGCWFAYKMAEQGFKVLVIEKQQPDNVSREYDVFHMGEKDMIKFDLLLPEEGDPLREFRFAHSTMVSPYGNYPKACAEEPVIGLHKHDYIMAMADRAKKAGAEVIFAPCSISYAQLIVAQAADQGISIPLLASDTWDSNKVLEAAKGKDVSVSVSTFYAEGGDPEFEKGFREWINADSKNLENNGGDDKIAAVSIMGYDAYFVALEALKAAGSTAPADVMAALPDVTYDGVSGAIAFDDVNGDAIRDAAYVKKCNTETAAWDFIAVQGIG
jgi:hypothetical protein